MLTSEPHRRTLVQRLKVLDEASTLEEYTATTDDKFTIIEEDDDVDSSIHMPVTPEGECSPVTSNDPETSTSINYFKFMTLCMSTMMFSLQLLGVRPRLLTTLP